MINGWELWKIEELPEQKTKTVRFFFRSIDTVKVDGYDCRRIIRFDYENDINAAWRNLGEILKTKSRWNEVK